MPTISAATPARDFELFMTSLTEALVSGAEEPGTVLDRFYTPDIEVFNDGIRLDRDKLVQHVRPTRKNLVSFRYEVHEALASGDRIAVRFTVHSVMRKGNTALATEVHLFGEFAPDGRIRRTHQLTRILPTEQAGG